MFGGKDCRGRPGRAVRGPSERSVMALELMVNVGRAFLELTGVPGRRGEDRAPESCFALLIGDLAEQTAVQFRFVVMIVKSTATHDFPTGFPLLYAG